MPRLSYGINLCLRDYAVITWRGRGVGNQRGAEKKITTKEREGGGRLDVKFYTFGEWGGGGGINCLIPFN